MAFVRLLHLVAAPAPARFVSSATTARLPCSDCSRPFLPCDEVVEPLLGGDVLGEAAQGDHRGVRVAVVEPRHRHLPAGIEALPFASPRRVDGNQLDEAVPDVGLPSIRRVSAAHAPHPLIVRRLASERQGSRDTSTSSVWKKRERHQPRPGRRMRSSSRRRRLLGRPSPRTAFMPGAISRMTGGGLLSM
jgi:hypothetical protein